MWIVALHAIHVAFDDGVMLRQIKFRVHIRVALETRARIFAGIYNHSPPAYAHMFAPWAVAGFATGALRKFDIVLAEASVRAHRERARNIRVTIDARRVADKMRARHMRRRDDRALKS
jgi:hypothetical protein